MSNSRVFGSPMILNGRKVVSPFGAASYAGSSDTAAGTTGGRFGESLRNLLAPTGRDRRIRQTVSELSKLDDRLLRDIGLDRSAIMSAAQNAEAGERRRFRR